MPPVLLLYLAIGDYGAFVPQQAIDPAVDTDSISVSVNEMPANGGLGAPVGVTVLDGSVYVTDAREHSIRRVGSVSSDTIAGGRPPGFSDGDGGDVQLFSPRGVAALGDALLVADSANAALRSVTRDGDVTTLFHSEGYAAAELRDAITAAGGDDPEPVSTRAIDGLWSPQGLASWSPTTALVADTDNHRILTFALGDNGWALSHFAGSGQIGFADGEASTARFSYPRDVAV